MSKFTVAKIREESKRTRTQHWGRRAAANTGEINVGNIRAYCDRIDFLCRTIARLEKK